MCCKVEMAKGVRRNEDIVRSRRCHHDVRRPRGALEGLRRRRAGATLPSHQLFHLYHHDGGSDFEQGCLTGRITGGRMKMREGEMLRFRKADPFPSSPALTISIIAAEILEKHAAS
ncbi:hypothetical protein WG66_001099 [Moniliophthora roreri]|uniref:Uncharacterized protein n=1 Tax=Moniliophthora roreri TaxID=221103 RepID=A0A0W0EU14_MONRR|nr:hypothetical protein WG66_001099 [Moniliophthora roreri]